MIADELYYVHQRPYSIRRVNKRNGGKGRIIREFTGKYRSIFSLKVLPAILKYCGMRLFDCVCVIDVFAHT